MLTIASTSFGEILKEALDSGPVLQVIKGLVITPNPNSATFTFQTRFASSPTVEIFNYVSGDQTKDIADQNLVTTNVSQLVGVPRKRTHTFRLPRPADWTPDNYPGLDDPLLSPLGQDSHYWFRITADSVNTGVIIPAATIGRFWTSQRSATAIIEELIVFQYGTSDVGSDVQDAVNSVASFFGASPPNPSIYHLDLAIGLFDQVNGPLTQLEKLFPSTQNNDDLRDPFPFQPLQAPNASDFLWLSSYGQGNGGAWGLGGFTGPAEAPDPNLPAPSNGVSAQGPWAEAAVQSPRLPDNYMEEQSTAPALQLILDSGDFGTSYEVIVWFSFAFVPPRHAPIIYASPQASLTDGLHAPEKFKHQQAKKLTTTDDGTLAFSTGKSIQLLVPGAGPALWSQTFDTAKTNRKAAPAWQKLGEGITAPMIVLPGPDDSVDMIASDVDGKAKHAKWDGTATGAAKLKWHDLGQLMTEEIAIARGTKSLDVFLLDSEGAVIQCPIGADGKPHKSTSLGGNLKTGLQAVATGDGETHVLGLGSKGEVWHCTVSESTGAGSKPTWVSLGGSHTLQLTVLPEGKHGLVIFAINKDRIVSRKTWNGKTWTPSAHDWKELGVLDQLFGPPKSAKS